MSDSFENFNLEDVFVTEGVPEFTFVDPPNYGEIYLDIRRPGKPLIIEGQSGTGKTTVIKRAILEAFGDETPAILTPRQPDDVPNIESISLQSGGATFIIDDFHRLPPETKERLADLSKVIAERDERENLPKLIIIGINNVGADLIQLVPDIAKRLGIHRVKPGTKDQIFQIIQSGQELLNIEILDPDKIFDESRGDYWLTQQLCKAICAANRIFETQAKKRQIQWNRDQVISSVVEGLAHNFDQPIRSFCRGRRFRPTNDPYYKLLKAVSEQDKSSVDLHELANSREDIRGSINNVKDGRLSVLIDQKEDCSRLFYYDQQTKNFALEDPALFFYIRHLDWDALRQRCGFREGQKDYEFDIAISFAGENRELASFITEQLGELDISVFYDKNYEDNYLGGPWSEKFREIFVEQSRLVVALLDEHHQRKVWPTFERDCFSPRVEMEEVIPIHLDATVFVGIPKDLVSIHFDFDGDVEKNSDRIIDEVVLRIAAKMDNL
jgi:hypothetical protein